ncbi:GFA family protein [Beggiatoa leptomitoformis]|uniref:GFA family protein n=1 Tax=Beggiatoa leptomitoformis TaxID=288004 RepID=A0A2N9YHU1_9GAMM|nr:GFA family protein [Beggiatoa leptomitoformis]ALG67663.1 GFA family protein [Beggiatoa leptomitoformis]AUI70102.1 GFA family protein [Beggiatoa leptomitoformis]
MSILGGCYCGEIRYHIEQTTLTDVAICHCSICRRVSGGTSITWASVPLTAFQWTQGEPAMYRSAPECERYFCSHCGTQLSLYTRLASDTLDISVTSLDNPSLYAPNRHIWVNNKLPWIILNDGLAQESEEIL